VERVRGIVTALVMAESMEGFVREAAPGWRVHRLSGDRRIVFEERDGGIESLNLEDHPPMSTGGIRIGMTPSHPGAFIRIEAIEEFGLTVAEAARILGVRRATLSDLVNGNASLSPEMALRVEKAFGLSMDLLLRMQAWHDAARMRARADEIDVRRYQPA